MKRKPLLRLLLSATLGAGLLAVYACAIEPRWLQITRRRVCLRGLPPGLNGLRLALLTDFHVGHDTSLSLIRRACQQTLAMQPDLIALTGDFVADDATTFRPVLDVLATLSAPLGVYAVPGNHDYRVGIARWHQEIQSEAPLLDLTNRARVQTVAGMRLCLAGVADFDEGRPRLSQLPPKAERDFTILLAHNPDQAEHLQDAAVDLVVSGHTHGGQVRLPWIGALRNPAHRADLYEQGLRRRPWTTVYVSRGIGTVHLPLRFLARPQIVILELISSPTAANNRLC